MAFFIRTFESTPLTVALAYSSVIRRSPGEFLLAAMANALRSFISYRRAVRAIPGDDGSTVGQRVFMGPLDRCARKCPPAISFPSIDSCFPREKLPAFRRPTLVTRRWFEHTSCYRSRYLVNPRLKKREHEVLPLPAAVRLLTGFGKSCQRPDSAAREIPHTLCRSPGLAHDWPHLAHR